MLAALVASNPFYRKKLEEAACGPDVAGIEDFTARAPFTCKQELVDDQALHPPFGSNLTFPLERYTRFCQTSGTTALPMRWLDTPESWSWMLDNWARVYEAAGVTRRDRAFFAFSFGPFLGFWAAFESAARLGCLCLPGGGMRSAARLQAILDNEVTALCCTPTYALRLAEAAVEEKIDLALSKVRRIILSGEPGGSIASTRARIEQLWPRARTLDHHGMTEIGPVSYGCPKRPGVLHIIDSAYIAEVIDPVSLRPAAPGARGELVLTNLGRVGSPLLRYRTGDIVQPGAPGVCACGTEDLALEGGILGRTDDLILVRGVNVYPSAVEHVLRAEPSVAEYQVEVFTERALTEMRIMIETVPGHARDGLEHRLEAAFSRSLGLRVPVTFAEHGTLPRFEMKAKRWVRVR
jgi:phenylacetate-CoA ligase